MPFAAQWCSGLHPKLKVKKGSWFDALVLFCVEFALPPCLQGLGMQSSFRVLRLSYVNC